MFVIGAIVILILSFVIAFVSLIREQRKVKGEFEKHSQDVAPAPDFVAPEAALPKKAGAEPKVDAEPVTPLAPSSPEPQPLPEPEKETETKTDDKKEPFPWETNQSEAAAPAVVDDVPVVAPISQENFILHPKRPSSGLGTTVSLKDLADKNKS